MEKGFKLLVSVFLVVFMSGVVSAATCGGAVNCSCGDTVTSDYTMTYDLIDCPGDGLILQSGGNDFNCNGHTIDGVGTSIGLTSNITYGFNIVNCNIQEFGTGIKLINTRGTVIRESTIKDNVDTGILMTGNPSYIENNVIDSSTIMNNRDGIIFSGKSQRVKNSLIRNNSQYGIKGSGINDLNYKNTIQLNTIWENGIGVYLVGGRVGVEENVFINNILHNGYDEGPGNLWDSGGNQGNSWSDFNLNPGFPNQYEVPGPGGGIDHYPSQAYAPESNCSNGIDDDVDDLIDCLDPDCDELQGSGGICEYQIELTCNDQFDNNANGDVDCADSECSSPCILQLQEQINQLTNNLQNHTHNDTSADNLTGRVVALEEKVSWLETMINKIIEFINDGLPNGLGKRFGL